MGKIVRWSGARYKVCACSISNAYKLALYTLILLKEIAARPRGEGFFIAKKKKCLAKRNFAQVSSTALEAPPTGATSAHELVVPLIKTDDNPADFFTEPVSSEKFFKFRAIIMNIKGGLTNAVKTALSAITHRCLSRCDLVRAELAYLSAAATRCLDRRLAGLPPLKADEVPAFHFSSRGPALRAELKKLSSSKC